jgi:hypothetical protein
MLAREGLQDLQGLVAKAAAGLGVDGDVLGQ